MLVRSACAHVEMALMLFFAPIFAACLHYCKTARLCCYCKALWGFVGLQGSGMLARAHMICKEQEC